MTIAHVGVHWRMDKIPHQIAAQRRWRPLTSDQVQVCRWGRCALKIPGQITEAPAGPVRVMRHHRPVPTPQHRLGDITEPAHHRHPVDLPRTVRRGCAWNTDAGDRPTVLALAPGPLDQVDDLVETSRHQH